MPADVAAKLRLLRYLEREVGEGFGFTGNDEALDTAIEALERMAAGLIGPGPVRPHAVSLIRPHARRRGPVPVPRPELR